MQKIRFSIKENCSVVTVTLYYRLSLQCLLDAATLTCTGCTQPPNEADYYCPGETQFLYLFCEAFNSAQLTWKIPNLISHPINFGAATMSVNNVITNNRVTAILDKKETNGGEIGNFSSHLWIDFRNVTNMELNITCETSTDTTYKELLPLGKFIIILFIFTSHAVLM